MPPASKRGGRAPAGPGRGKPRPRAGVRVPAASQVPSQPIITKVAAASKGLGLTRRAIVFIAIIGVLSLSYANSMRIYFTQQHDLAVARQQISERTAHIGELQAEIARWNDPDFIRTQARERLGWVLPGETGYQVLTDDGKLMGNGISLTQTVDSKAMWWDRMQGSIRVADDPGRKQ